MGSYAHFIIAHPNARSSLTSSFDQQMTKTNV